MNPLILIAGMLALPLVVLTLLRVNAAIVFLSLCLGSVLVRFVGDDTQSFVGMFASSKGMSTYVVSVGLLLAPAIFTTLVMIGTARGKIRLILNILPAAAVGVVGLLLAEPLVSPGLRGAIAGTAVWHDIQRTQTLAVTLSTLVSLLFLWWQRPKRALHESDKRRHR